MQPCYPIADTEPSRLYFMATTKRTFDAVAESRRWRIEARKRLSAMTPAERREHLRRVTEKFFAKKPSRWALAMLSR
jgi:hypothetical protein